MRRLAALVAGGLLAMTAAAAPPSASAPPSTAAAKAKGAIDSLHAPRLVGTWEFRSMKRPDGATLAPPVGTGVIVIDEKGNVLAASYVQASASRRVGNVWEGTMTVTKEGRFEVHPERGARYDSAASPAVVSLLPPPSSGTVEVTDGGIRLQRDGGGEVYFENAGRRVQTDPDGTVVVHERTSLLPKIPDSLPGRTQ